MSSIQVHFFLLLTLILLAGRTTAQNLFDTSHIHQYGNYLYRTGDYTNAITEYERLLLIDSLNENYKYRVFNCLMKTANYNRLLLMSPQLFPDSLSMPKRDVRLFVHALTKIGQYDRALQFASLNNNYTSIDKHWTEMNMLVFKGDFKQAFKIYQDSYLADTTRFVEYKPMFNEIATWKPKSRVKAAVLSTVIPGLGKVYTGEWRDGAINFISVSIWGYLAYRGFAVKGTSSGLGYISSFFGAGFYLGNIYGSALSARRVNDDKKDDWIDQAKENFEAAH